MSERIQWTGNRMPKSDCSASLALMREEEIVKARGFHSSFPQYSMTPLEALPNLAQDMGLGGIYIKDESKRFGLNAFKVLGGSFAMAKFIAETVGRDVTELGYDQLTSDEVRKELGEYTFFTATDGNHGRGVAWTANQIRQKAVVYMPKGSSDIRLQNILAEGADASITDMNYDDAVRLAAKHAGQTNNGVVVQDTAWEGYEKIPGWIMQGYGTMALEAAEQLRAMGVDRPTHVIVQAGVGSLAGAVQGFFANLFPENCPTTIVVEAAVADCLYRSAVNADGQAVAVGGDLFTIMAGLACGEANTISWEILRNWTSYFVSLPDWAAARGMRVLSSPLPGDPRVVSGESGAATLGFLSAIMTRDEYKELREQAGLNKDSKVLLFSTEGDTDPDKYRSIVWDGECESTK